MQTVDSGDAGINQGGTRNPGLGDLEGAYARRINIQHKLIYQVSQREKMVKVIRMWTHYE